MSTRKNKLSTTLNWICWGKRREKTNLHATNQSNKNSSNSIISLSQHRLSPAEESVLSCGLSFCPTKSTQIIQFCRDLEAFSHHLYLKEYFHYTPKEDENGQHLHSIRAHNLLKTSYYLSNPPVNKTLSAIKTTLQEYKNKTKQNPKQGYEGIWGEILLDITWEL